MDAIALLEADHATVEGLFQQVESTDSSEHPAIFDEINLNLQAHAQVEESIFYPSLQSSGNEALIELTAEALQEHQQTKAFLGQLSAAAGDSDKFAPLLTQLIEDVRHHVEEEVGEMFPMVREQFDEARLEDWGTQMEAEKERFLASAESIHN